MLAGDRIPIRRVQGDPAARLLYPRQRNGSGPLKILISAAETSSDAHGAELLRALRAESSRTVEAFGMGGPKLQAAGLRTLVDARGLLSMGFLEILGRLPKIWSALGRLTSAAEQERPDLAIVIDYPDFHFRLARRLKRLGVPVVYYIPPKVWVWRKKRILVLKELFAKVLSILPFEEEFYARENVPVKYVGNPLVDELPMQLTRAEARTRLGISEKAKTLVLMAGSRPAELKLHLELMLDAAAAAARELREKGILGAEERLQILMPFALTTDLLRVRERVDAWVHGATPLMLDVRLSQGDAHECMIVADAGLIKSGTSTLEAALLGCPHSIVFKPGRVTEWIFKNLIRYRGPVGLSNLVAGWKPGDPYLVNEILCSDVTVKALSDEIVALMTEPSLRDRLRTGFSEMKKRVIGSGRSPSHVAALEVLALVDRKGS